MRYSDSVKSLARACMDVYGNDDEAGLSFNVLVTQRCPFECLHCLNDSGPTRPKTTFSEKDAMDLVGMDQAVKKFFRNEDTGGTSFNLIGGEPTLYPDVLGMLLRVFEPYGQLEMTTNGWWLRSAAAFVRTMSVLEPYLQDMSIRISHSKYHTQFRAADLHVVENLVRAQLRRSEPRYGGDRPRRSAETCLDSSPLWSLIEPVIFRAEADEGKRAATCPECNSWVDVISQESECQACGHTFCTESEHGLISSKAYEACGGLIGYAEKFMRAWAEDHLHVEHQVGEALATGRAGPEHTQCGTKGGMCYVSDRVFTVAPGGVIQDMCCSGVPIGTVPAGHVSEGVAAAIRRVQLVRLIDRRYKGRNPYTLQAHSACYEACTNCNKSIYAVVNGRTCRSEVEDTIRYLKHYGKRLKVQEG